EGNRELTTQPAADPAFQPRGNNINTAMEVSGSDAVLVHSETENVNQGPQQHTGFEPRAERQSLDTKCDMNGGINLLRDSLNQVWREVVATDDGTSAAHTKVMDLGNNTTQLVSPGFWPSEINTGSPGTGNAGEANKASWCLLASLQRHSEIPGRGVQQPAHTSLPDSATTSSHSSNLATHVRPGTVERPYGCPSCHKKFVHESDLRHHMVIHTRKRVFACTLCEKSFVSPSKLQVHQNVHTGEKPFSCAQCGRSNLATHIRPGTIERRYGCPSCNKKFVHESDLRQHVVVHTRKRVFACTLCEKSFVSPSKLQVHQNVHTGEKKRGFACTFCEKSFEGASHLQMHLNVHTGEKPFSCAHCGRRFSHTSNLKRHQKGERPPAMEERRGSEGDAR
uniref:C2H2-type domain-containing protein n=1 Tax=Hucho hucho TaxID=62062 RepID=A0A4W5Q7B9_9TELE